MQLYPAIDMKNGRCVRLCQGKFKNITVYSEHPEEIAALWQEKKATFLHLVDLDGALAGRSVNEETIKKIVSSVNIPVEIGGGIRSLDTIARYLDAGVERVILGTQAVTDPEFLEAAVRRFGAQAAVGVDLKDGAIAIRGWKETAPEPAEQFFARLCALGVRTVICTDVSRDGMLGGTNVALYRALSQQFDLDLIASGGVSSMEDLQRLKEIGLYGAILGKALYTGALELRRALREVE